MKELDDLLQRYEKNKKKSDSYLLEVEEIRGQIEYELDKNKLKSYENTDWQITKINEKEQRNIKLEDFANAINNAQLNPKQKSIFDAIISQRDHQSHIRIKKID